MKKLLGFGSFSDNSVCMGLFITSFLILFRFLYFWSIGISIYSSSAEKIIYNLMINYVRFFEPIVILIWLKLVCEYLFKLLKRN